MIMTEYIHNIIVIHLGVKHGPRQELWSIHYITLQATKMLFPRRTLLSSRLQGRRHRIRAIRIVPV